MSGDNDDQRDLAAGEFLRKVTSALRPLTSIGLLNFETSRYDEKFFGNAFVTFRGKHVLVRFVRDRGQESVELACLNKAGGWQPIERVLSAVGVLGPPEEGTIGVNAQAELLIRHVNVIEMQMCTAATARKLSDLEAAATLRVLESLKRLKPD